MKTHVAVAWCLFALTSCGDSPINSPIKDTPQQFAQDQYVSTPNGVLYHDITVGTGNITQLGYLLTVNYAGWLTTGPKFDSSIDRRTPYQFILGAGRVISGWEEGVMGMRGGGHRQLIIPPAMAYGQTGSGGVIPPDATLIFEIELISVQ